MWKLFGLKPPKNVISQIIFGQKRIHTVLRINDKRKKKWKVADEIIADNKG